MREAYAQQEFSREEKFFREEEFLRGERFLKEEDSFNSHTHAQGIYICIYERHMRIRIYVLHAQQEFPRKNKSFGEEEFLKGEEFFKEEDSLNNHTHARGIYGSRN
jgi:hypothetical protein